jgi:RNA polymerase sigma-70 factor (sigma-E family)
VRDDSFREFVTGATPALSRTAYLLTGDHQLAEDLLQSALANAYRHWPKLRRGNPTAYVRRAMHHEQISWWRRRRLTEQPHAEPPVPDRGGTDLASVAALRLTLVQALAKLPPRQRAVIVLRFYDDLTEVETARVLDCTVGTVKRHGHDALVRLRALVPQAVLEQTEVRS